MNPIPKEIDLKIRQYAKSLVYHGVGNSADLEDLYQSGLVGYLVEPTMDAAKKAMNKDRYERNRAREFEDSLDMPLGKEGGPVPFTLADTLQDESVMEQPNWVPRDPASRMRIIEACANNNGTIRRSKVGKARVLGDDFEALISLLGHEYYLGRFPDQPTAQRALNRSYRVLQDWCSPIYLDEDQEDGAERFVQAAAMERLKPRVFYGDPLELLLFLEDFKERVRQGDIYYPETQESALRKRIRNNQASRKAT